MSRRKKTTDVAVPPTVAERPTDLRRTYVLLSESDAAALENAASNIGVAVTAYAPVRSAAGAYRKAYAQRPEVREKRKAYLAKRRAEKRALREGQKA
jgi:hypothetical protein